MCVCVLYLGCADRKGEGSLQRLRWLHCSGGRLFAWEALRWECWGQQVRYTHTLIYTRQVCAVKHTHSVAHLLVPCSQREQQQCPSLNKQSFVLSAPLPQSYHYPGRGSHPHVSRVHTGVRETATAVPGKKEPSSAPF